MYVFGAIFLAAQIMSADGNPAATPTAIPMRRIDPLSATSLLLKPRKDGKNVATATGFVVAHGNRLFLITNRHVVTGYDPWRKKQTFIAPDALWICHHGMAPGAWSPQVEPLFEAGKRRWLEHPLGPAIDVVALPLTSLPSDKVKPYPLNYAVLAESDMELVVAMPVSIVGFPEGMSGPGGFAVWKTGHVASDPDLDLGDKPLFLIDATTRGGMSGSPVYLRVTGGYTKRGGGLNVLPGVFTRFLGVYSAQAQELEIGFVWKPQVITEILEAGN